MAEERELILKLGQKITDRIGHKVTVEDPEYYGLACVVTDEMAEIWTRWQKPPARARRIWSRCCKR